MLGPDIRGSTIGIVGLGGIGFNTAKKLKAFNPGKIIYSGHREKPYGKLFEIYFFTYPEKNALM